jgi:hypothetical protein
LLDGLFEHPASRSCAIAIRKITVDFLAQIEFSHSLLEALSRTVKDKM